MNIFFKQVHVLVLLSLIAISSFEVRAQTNAEKPEPEKNSYEEKKKKLGKSIVSSLAEVTTRTAQFMSDVDESLGVPLEFLNIHDVERLNAANQAVETFELVQLQNELDKHIENIRTLAEESAELDKRFAPARARIAIPELIFQNRNGNDGDYVQTTLKHVYHFIRNMGIFKKLTADHLHTANCALTLSKEQTKIAKASVKALENPGKTAQAIRDLLNVGDLSDPDTIKKIYNALNQIEKGLFGEDDKDENKPNSEENKKSDSKHKKKKDNKCEYVYLNGFRYETDDPSPYFYKLTTRPPDSQDHFGEFTYKFESESSDSPSILRVKNLNREYFYDIKEDVFIAGRNHTIPANVIIERVKEKLKGDDLFRFEDPSTPIDGLIENFNFAFRLELKDDFTVVLTVTEIIYKQKDQTDNKDKSKNEKPDPLDLQIYESEYFNPIPKRIDIYNAMAFLNGLSFDTTTIPFAKQANNEIASIDGFLGQEFTASQFQQFLTTDTMVLGDGFENSAYIANLLVRSYTARDVQLLLARTALDLAESNQNAAQTTVDYYNEVMKQIEVAEQIAVLVFGACAENHLEIVDKIETELKFSSKSFKAIYEDLQELERLQFKEQKHSSKKGSRAKNLPLALQIDIIQNKLIDFNSAYHFYKSFKKENSPDLSQTRFLQNLYDSHTDASKLNLYRIEENVENKQKIENTNKSEIENYIIKLEKKDLNLSDIVQKIYSFDEKQKLSESYSSPQKFFLEAENDEESDYAPLLSAVQEKLFRVRVYDNIIQQFKKDYDQNWFSSTSVHVHKNLTFNDENSIDDTDKTITLQEAIKGRTIEIESLYELVKQAGVIVRQIVSASYLVDSFATNTRELEDIYGLQMMQIQLLKKRNLVAKGLEFQALLHNGGWKAEDVAQLLLFFGLVADDDN